MGLKRQSFKLTLKFTNRMESATFYNSLIQDYGTLTRKFTVSTRV